MTDFPDVKLKAMVSFPAMVHGGTGIDVSKSNGAYTFDLDYSEIATVNSVADLTTSYLLLWDQTTDSYSRVSLTNLKTVLGIP